MNTTETVLITGGTGLIGRHLSEKLKKKGYQVKILSRNADLSGSPGAGAQKSAIDASIIEKADYIVHLAGANIGNQRWTKRRRQEIIDSRLNTSQMIFQIIEEKGSKLKAFVSASAIGYYGTITSDRIFQEADLPAGDFLGQVCKKWEQSADRFAELGIRTVKIRTGIVLAKNEGALARITIPVRLGIGSAIGSGKQYMPWIHIDDLCDIYVKAIEDTRMIGAYNAVAPDHKTNMEFMKTLARVLKKPFWFPYIPAFVVQLVFGRMADILLKGSRISSGRIINAGYDFHFTDLESALTELLIIKKT